MKLVLRADVSPDVGAGHVARMIALAEEAVTRGWQVFFSGMLGGVDWLTSRFDELDVPQLPPDVTVPGVDAVVVDHYGIGEIRREINDRGALLVSFEDGLFGRRQADIVVDCGLTPSRRTSDGSPVVCTGAEYVPLRQAVVATRQQRQQRQSETQVPSVLVVLGGSAVPDTLVTALLRAVRDTGLPCTTEALARGAPVVPGPLPGQRFMVSPPGPGLFDKLLDVDLVISAAGVTLMELCCIGVPTALVQLVENQAAGYRAAVEYGFAAGLGSPQRLDGAAEVLTDLLIDSMTRIQMATAAAAAVDGRGAARVLDVVERVAA